MSIDISKPILDDKIMPVVVNKLTGRCYPYGDTHIDEGRKENLKIKIAVVESLFAEIIEAGKLYERAEYSIQDISNTANQWLVDMRDWLNDIDYLPKPYKESDDK